MNLSCAFTMPAAMVKWRTRTGSRRQGTGDGGQFFSRSRKLEGSTCDQEGAVAHHDIRIGLHLAEPLLTRAEPQRAYHSRYSRCIPRIFILIFICARPLFLVDNMLNLKIKSWRVVDRQGDQRKLYGQSTDGSRQLLHNYLTMFLTIG